MLENLSYIAISKTHPTPFKNTSVYILPWGNIYSFAGSDLQKISS